MEAEKRLRLFRGCRDWGNRLGAGSAVLGTGVAIGELYFGELFLAAIAGAGGLVSYIGTGFLDRFFTPKITSLKSQLREINAERIKEFK